MRPEHCRRRAGGLLLALAIGTCAHAGGDDQVGFRAQVVPILNANCVACHLTGQEQGNLALHPRAAHASLVGVPSEQSPLLRVEPGRPEDSYLYHKLRNTHLEANGEGEPMPMGRGLDPEQISLIARWIEQGAAAD